MNIRDKSEARNIISGASAVLAAAAAREISRTYHAFQSLTFEDAGIWVYLATSLAILLVSFRSDIWAGPRLTFSKWWVANGVVLSSIVVLGGSVSGAFGGTASPFTITAAIVFGGLLCHGISDSNWSRVRRVAGTTPWLIVIAPILASHWITKPITWIEKSQGNFQKKEAVIFLLLDELNYSNSDGLAEILRSHDLNVSSKPLNASHNSTAEVIPAMFTGQDFRGARACAPAIVCAKNSALDFSRIRVERNDVDVVGFYHPYCSIGGLRSCQRVESRRSLFEPGRIQCAMNSLFGQKVATEWKYCEQLSHRWWVDFRNRVTANLLNVQTLREGGILYAHIPVPHPPGAETGSLAAQYRSNIEYAKNSLSRIANTLEANNIRTKWIITSDHPLRQALWCTNQAKSFDLPCNSDPALNDTKVPLIIASQGPLPSLSAIDENKQVFGLMRTWLAN